MMLQFNTANQLTTHLENMITWITGNQSLKKNLNNSLETL